MSASQDDAGPAVTAPSTAAEQALVFPASFAQSRLWFMDRLAPGAAVSYVPLVIGLSGPLDVELLAQCLTAVARRHEVLRTTFAEDAEGLLQIVLPPAPVRIEVRDIRADQVEQAVSDEVSRPFDLTAGPLLRTLVLRTGPTEHTLVVTFHHAICDGWSLEVFCRELGTLYQAHTLGLASPLPDLDIQYADYAVWQRGRLESRELKDHLTYWRERLADAPALLNLPTDRPRPPIASHRGAQVPVTIPQPLADELRALAHTARCTPFMLLLAAYQLLLARWTGQSDICVGTPVAGRDRPELEPLIGYFANIVVLRGDIRDEMTFHQLLARTRESTLADLKHQEAPFDRLVEELRPRRDLDHHPLVQAAFVPQNTEPDTLHLPGVRSRITEPVTGTAQFDLTLSLEEDTGGFTGVLEYSTDLFDAASATVLADTLPLLLRNAVAAPDVLLASLALLPADTAAEPVAPHPGTMAADRRTPSADQRATGTLRADAGTTLTELFERQAARCPDATAVVGDGTRLSYSELNQRANRLARRLVEAGAGPERLVALALPRCAELIVALLAVLKSGAAYLPVDPAVPTDRARRILADARPSSVLTTSEIAARLLLDDLHTVLLTDDPATHLSATDVARSTADLTNADRSAPLNDVHLAYVIYTSGSTGRPKGVVVPHRQVVRLLTAADRRFVFGPDDVWTPVPLLRVRLLGVGALGRAGARRPAGGGAVTASAARREAFLDLLVAERVTVLNQTPSAFRQLRAVVDGHRPTLAGLALRTGHLRRRGAGRRRACAAGSTGTATDARAGQHVRHHGDDRARHRTGRSTADDLRPAAGSPIGAPIPDLRAPRARHRGCEPVPPGCRGELCVGGAGPGPRLSAAARR